MFWLWISLAILTLYIALSITLLFFPTLLHKKKMIKFRAKHISHRAGCGERLENTLPAFQNAFDNHTDMFEIDVQLTKDGKVVVFHDCNLKRVTGVDLMVSECNFEDLPLVKTTLELPLDAGAATYNEGRTVTWTEGDRHIPLLRTILEKYPAMPLNIDTKKNDEVIDETIKLIREFKREHNVVMVNKRSQAICMIHERAPDLLIGISFKRAVLTLVTFWSGLLPFLIVKESFFQCEIPRGIWRFLLPRVFFRHFQKRGLRVHFFTANDEDKFSEFYNGYEVDGLMTDFPEKLDQFLQNSTDAELKSKID